MYDDIHPIAPPPGTVPDGLAPYRPPRRRFGLFVASVVVAAGVGAGGFAVIQAASQQGPAVSASQGTEDGGAAENADAPAPAPVQPAQPAGEQEND